MNVFSLIRGRLAVLKVPSLVAFQIATEVKQFIDHNGPEWTVDRLKAIKQYALGGPPPTGVKLNKENMPRGPISFIFRRLEDRSPKVRKRVFNALLCYTAMCKRKGSKPTHKQERKFLDAVEAVPKVYGACVDVQALTGELTRRGWEEMQSFSLMNEKSMEEMTCSPSHTAPLRTGKNSIAESIKGAAQSHRIKHEAEFFKRQLEWLNDVPFIRSTSEDGVSEMKLFQEDALPPFISRKERKVSMDMWEKTTTQNIDIAGMELPSLSLLRGQYHWLTRGHAFPIVGKIGCSQEPGMKARFYASPNRVLQHYLRPLGRFFFKMLRMIPEDCTYRQDKSVLAIQYALQHGITVYSFDLSNASDCIPLGMQMRVAKKLAAFFKDDEERSLQYKLLIKTFVLASRGYWYYNGRYIRWTTGQPLGLYPSFPAFTLAHHALVRRCMEEVGAPRSLNVTGDVLIPRYFILGDDIVILDDDVASKYVQYAHILGMKISETKSLVSNRVAEFAGKVITPETLYDTYKYREISDDNFVDFVCNLGLETRTILSSRQKTVINMLLKLHIDQGGLSEDDWSTDHNFMMKPPRVRTDIVNRIRFLHAQNKILYKRVGWRAAFYDKTSLKEEILQRLEAEMPGVGRLTNPVLEILRKSSRSIWSLFNQDLPFFIELEDYIVRGFDFYSKRLDHRALERKMEKIENILSAYSLSGRTDRKESRLEQLERKYL